MSGQWKHFADAIRDLKAPDVLDPITRVSSEFLVRSERFYLPHGSSVLDGRILDDEVKALMYLPADIVSVLWETDMHDGEGLPAGRTLVITLAMNLDRVFFPGFIAPHLKGAADFFVISLLKTASTNRWVSYGCVIGVVLTPEGEAGYKLLLFDTPAVDMCVLMCGSREKLLEEHRSDVSAVMNLCTLLNTKVAQKERRTPPRLLSKMRASASKPPLPDYHVLKVGGETWDKPHVESSGDGRSGHAVRSHFRRGHIRHLSGDRFVWVRNTVVTGSRPGFVDKEYRVATAPSESRKVSSDSL